MKRLALLCILTGCIGAAKPGPDTLVIGIESEIKSLDFRFATDANTAHLMKIFTQSLIDLGPDFSPQPDLAVSFKVENEKIFHFELPKQGTFHDGSPITCEDVKASFTQASQPPSQLRSLLRDAEEFVCEGSRFTIRLKASRPFFLGGVVAAVRILPKEWILGDKMTGGAPGSGPFRFVKRQGRDLLFERFDGYPRPVAFKHLIIRSVEDPTTRYLSLVGGDVDILLNALSPKKVVEAEKNPRLVVAKLPGSSHAYLGFNLKLPKFRDVRVRQAVAYAIPREDIIQHKFLGLARPASSVVSLSDPYLNKSLPGWPYDPVKARALLKEAKAEGLEIEIRCSSDPDVVSTLLILKKALNDVGFKAELRCLEFATFFSEVQKGSFEMYYLRWTGLTQPVLLNRIYHSREFPPGRNRVFYSNPELDALLDRGEGEPDLKKRHEIYDRAQKIVFDELPSVPLWYPDNVAVYTKRLKDFELHPSGTWATLWKARKE